jgi:hypothetical protein
MILPDFVCPSRVNQQWKHSGLDSPDVCLDKKHFDSYPYSVDYLYNSRGYRDQEWPTQLDQLKDAIWCVGDSFTVGIGNPVEHIWPHLLQQYTGHRTINVSMDGASNEWMTRKIKTLVEDIAPKTIIVQWSYFTRRESSTGSNDEDRKIRFDPLVSDEEDFKNFKNCVLQTQQISENCQLINSVIPYACAGISVKEVRGWWYNDRQSDWPEILPATLADIPTDIQQQLKHKNKFQKYFMHYQLQQFAKNNNIILVDQLDEFYNKRLARDGHHYELVTATNFVKQLLSKLNLV